MKTYEQKYKESVEEYNQMLAEYKELTENERYQEIVNCMPFEFLCATHICQSLQLYTDITSHGTTPHPQMHFANAYDAVSFYRKLLSLKTHKSALLEGADYIMEVVGKADAINHFAKECPYLGNRFTVTYDADIAALARECLEELPHYKTNMTKKFRYNFLESAIACSGMEELDYLVTSKVIAPSDLDHIALSGEGMKNPAEYQEKIRHLCEVLKHPQPLCASYEVNLKGVTFANEDGSSRQEILKEVKEKREKGEEVSLTAVPFLYTPEIGAPRQAVKILWNEKCLGMLGQDVVDDLYQKYQNPQLTVALKEITGGGKTASFGCHIAFGVIAPQAVMQKEEVQVPAENAKTPADSERGQEL